ncbi:MAG: DUF885 domain-containing protein [bacterium]|nr:DUF885 domain-containing protein [bacterium]
MIRVLQIGAVGLVAALVFLIPTLWGTPWSIDHFFLRSLVTAVAEHPALLSYARPLEAYGLDFYSDDLEDYSVAGDEAIFDRVDQIRSGLHAYDRAELSAEQQLSYDVLDWLLSTQQAGRAFLYHTYPLNQFQGSQSGLPDFMVNIHQVNDERDARNFLARVGKFEIALEQMREAVLARAERGFLPPRFVLEAVEREAASFASTPTEQNVLYSKLASALDEISEISPDTREALLQELREQIEEIVQPGYRRLAATSAELAARANDDDGVWKHPDGEAYYRWALRWHTTTDKTPDEIHRIGLAEIERIHGEMSRILAAQGLRSDKPIEALLQLNREPRFLYPDTDEGRAEILRDYRGIIAEVGKRLPEMFGRLPEAPVEVERVPVFKEAGSAGAYYQPPSLDGSRPGVFFANLRDVSEVQRFRMRTLSFHEAVPGHHLQIALAMETSDLPHFRRFMPMTAFIEGWALYAERIAMEAGLHKTAFDELGGLSAELFRAVRLVVDTGIHAKRWTRERAIEFMIENAGLPRGDATAEIERYIVLPGQACAYKIGQLKILELRERARTRLGDEFDLRAFNDAILANGSLPLKVLDDVLMGWIEAR